MLPQAPLFSSPAWPRGLGWGRRGRVVQVWSLPCRPFLISFSSGQHLNKEFFPVNSLQRVPTLKDGDFVLSER